MRAPRGSACAERVWCCYPPTRSEDPALLHLGSLLGGCRGRRVERRRRTNEVFEDIRGSNDWTNVFRIAEKKPTIVPTAFDDADSLDVIAARAPLASVVPRGWRTCRRRFRNVVARARASGRIDSLRRAR